MLDPDRSIFVIPSFGKDLAAATESIEVSRVESDLSREVQNRIGIASPISIGNSTVMIRR